MLAYMYSIDVRHHQCWLAIVVDNGPTFNQIWFTGQIPLKNKVEMLQPIKISIV